MSDLITKVGECTIAVPMPAKPRLRWSEEAERAELVRKGLEEAKGSWPDHCLQRAFVAGAKWWEFERTGATMWQDDLSKAEQSAIDKYGIDPVVVPSQIGGDFCQLQAVHAPKSVFEDGFDISTFHPKNFEECMLFMGGEWLKGFNVSGEGMFFSKTRSRDWDEHNQPTRWKPL